MHGRHAEPSLEGNVARPEDVRSVMRWRFGIGLAIALVSPMTVLAQRPAAPWYSGVWPVDGRTVLAVRARTGQEVRSGRRGMRHGREVPLVVEDDGDTVRFEIASGADYAKRWILRRHEGEVRIEEWTRRGPDGVAWERVRVVIVPLERVVQAR